ncbi:cupin domain-containing protein [uncultured Massilia sp.]|uniref:cupin domain-containing protein n=1 Tax=uncultured Massilia sp. TaxID=169973 RepID=UPI0025D4E184|nr:cupin domain-containing protein [uncultured Massilia sp.]
MLVNADFSRPAIVTPRDYRWVDSPQSGVRRVMLDRVGAEQARATSLVRYAADSRFPPHRHPGGEEILVVSGTFSDEDGNYPAGWYLRNPPGSGHRPFSVEGALIFVKLRQMDAGEGARVRVDTRDAARWQRRADRAACPLFADASEQVSLQRLDAGAGVFAGAVDGAELLVLGGSLAAGDRVLDEGSWLRLPAGAHPDVRAGAGGATFYLKTGRPGGLAPQDRGHGAQPSPRRRMNGGIL